jgi:hypothetical protein
MAKAVGVSHRSVQRVWAGAGLKPHLVSTFKVSNDPKFAENVVDVVGLYMNPPEGALLPYHAPPSPRAARPVEFPRPIPRTRPNLNAAAGQWARIT